MIEKADAKDVLEIQELCIGTHPVRETNFFQYYFSEKFMDGNTYYMRVDQKIVATMSLCEHTLKLHNQYLLTSYISGVCTHPDYRNRGYMNELMHFLVDYCNQNYLLTFIEAYNPKIYKKYGFEVIANRKKYNILASDLTGELVGDIRQVISPKELENLYRQFSNRFNCFYVRDEAYYEAYLKRITYEKGNVIGYFNKQGIAQGYCVYYERDEVIEIKEIIYLDSNTLTKLIKYAIAYMPYISVEVSNNEKLEKIFKQAVPRSQFSIMGRINNYQLFEKLFGKKSKSVKEAIHLHDKPILINERY